MCDRIPALRATGCCYFCPLCCSSDLCIDHANSPTARHRIEEGPSWKSSKLTISFLYGASARIMTMHSVICSEQLHKKQTVGASRSVSNVAGREVV